MTSFNPSTTLKSTTIIFIMQTKKLKYSQKPGNGRSGIQTQFDSRFDVLLKEHEGN